MNYFQYNFGDIAVLTDGMGLVEYALFHKFLTRYLKTEEPIKTQWVSMAFPENKERAFAVLDATFVKKQGLNGDEWTNPTLDNLILGYKNKAETNRENGKKGGRPRKNNPTESEKNPDGFSSVSENNPIVTQSQPNRNPTETLTNNHKPITNINIKEVPRKDADALGADAPPELFPSGEQPKGKNTLDAVNRVVDLYNSTLGNGLGKVVRLTDKRKAAVRKLWKEIYSTNNCRTDEECVNAFVAYFTRIERTDFLMGRNQPDNGRNWKASFDWVINVNNWVKVVEGKYGGDFVNKNTQPEDEAKLILLKKIKKEREEYAKRFVDTNGSSEGELLNAIRNA